MDLEESENAVEESTVDTTTVDDRVVGDEKLLAEENHRLPALPFDSWLLITNDLTLIDITNCSMVSREWNRALKNDKLWRCLCQRFSIPSPPNSGNVVWREHFIANKSSVIGPTVVYRQKNPNVRGDKLPQMVANAMEALYIEGRRFHIQILRNTLLLLTDEIGVVTIQLVPPFKISKAYYEFKEDDAKPVAQRRAWSDGQTVVVQKTFEKKSKPMDVVIYSLKIKSNGSGVELNLLGSVTGEKSAESAGIPCPFLMNAFFGKSFFLLEFCDGHLTTGIVCRVQVYDLKIVRSIRLEGSFIGSGQKSSDTMPSSFYTNWKFFVLRKFPKAEGHERERLFVYDHNLELIHEYSAPVGERWRYPFIRSVFHEYIMLEYFDEEPFWSVYKVGGPVVCCVFKKQLVADHLSKHIPGCVFDSSGVVLTLIDSSKKKKHNVNVTFFPFMSTDKKRGESLWSYAVDSFETEIDRKTIRVFYGNDGLVLYFFSGHDYAPMAGQPAKLVMFKFSPQHSRSLLKNSIRSMKSQNLQSETDAVSARLQKELLNITSQMSVEELMELVAHAKKGPQKKE